jgi:UDP-N-acetylmuramate dehydrogenase
MNPRLLETKLARVLRKGALRSAVPGSALTTFGIGGPLEYLIEPGSLEELSQIMEVLRAEGLDRRILGAGSNLVISSQGVPGCTIHLGRAFRETKPAGPNLFEIGAGAPLMLVSRELSEQGLSGLEFAGGIPASLGGAVFMNAGAHGCQLSDVIKSVTVLTAMNEVVKLPRSEIRYNYRSSQLPPATVIVAAEIGLAQEDPKRVKARRAEFLEERRSKQPLNFPSAGSIFKNPGPDRSAGFLLDQAGLKGIAIGGAKVSEQHANWIINYTKQASSEDVLKLISLCKARVLEKFNTRLETEVRVWP